MYTEDTHSDLWARTQRSLGIAHARLASVSHRDEDRERADRHFENALRVRSRESHPHEWASTVEALVEFRIDNWTASTEDLTEGFRLLDEAAEVHRALGDDRALHTNRTARLGLVQQLDTRRSPAQPPTESSSTPDDLDKVRGLLANAPAEERPGQHRLLAAHLGDLLAGLGRWDEAADAYRSAFAADERLVSASVTRAGREAATGRPVARDAAYALARAGRPDEAVVVLERGRARALGDRLGDDLTGAGPSVSRLAEIDPDLAGRYRAARERLRAAQDADLSGSIGRRFRPEAFGDVGRPPQDDDRHFADIARRTRDAAAAVSDLLHRIRQLPGFAEFRRPADFETIRGAAEPGCPLVYLATTRRGSVMLIVTRSPDGDWAVDTVWSDFTDADAYSILMHSDTEDSRFPFMNGYAMRLEGLVETVFASGSSALTRGAAFGQGVRQRTGREEDGGMWRLGERVVAPLARALERHRATDIALVISGRLGEFPVHTAPFHSGADAPRLIDTVDVALVPSARVLLHARDRARAAWAAPSFGGLANPMPHGTPLAFAVQEVKRVASLFPRATVHVDTDATRFAALHELRSATHVHLACHGSYQLGDHCPHLEFENGAEVELSDIIREQPFAAARLVTLSACQTAIPSARAGENDEVDGLPSALLGAGIPAVIATLWPVDDLSTTLLMERFYAFHLFGDPGTGDGPLSPHRALCRAQRWLARVTAGELAEFFARQPSLGRDVDELPSGPRYPAATAARNALRFGSRDPHERPFAEDWFWGAFVLVGA